MKLQTGEQILWEGRPEPRIIFVWFFTKMLAMTAMYGFITVYINFFITMMIASAHRVKHPSLAGVLDTVIFIVPIVFLVSVMYYRHLRKTYRYFITNQRCVFEGGLFVRRRRNVPFHKITDVEVNQNILEQLVGLSSLKIFTPGTGSAGMPGFEKAEIVFCGLDDVQGPAGVIQDILSRFKATGE